MVIHFSTILPPRENSTVNLTEMMSASWGVGGGWGWKRAFSCSKMSSVRTSMKGRRASTKMGKEHSLKFLSCNT